MFGGGIMIVQAVFSQDTLTSYNRVKNDCEGSIKHLQSIIGKQVIKNKKLCSKYLKGDKFDISEFYTDMNTNPPKIKPPNQLRQAIESYQAVKRLDAILQKEDDVNTTINTIIDEYRKEYNKPETKKALNLKVDEKLIRFNRWRKSLFAKKEPEQFLSPEKKLCVESEKMFVCYDTELAENLLKKP